MVNSYSFYNSYCEEYRRVLWYAISQGWRLPSIRQQIIQNRFMVKIIASGAFAKADWIYYMANDCDRNGAVNFCRINWKNPGQYTLTEHDPSEPVRYLKNYGPYFNTESAIHNYFKTGWAFYMGPNFTQNNNSRVVSTESAFRFSGGLYHNGVSGVSNTLLSLFDVLIYASNNTASNVSSALLNNFPSFLNRRTASNSGVLVYNNGGTISNLVANFSNSTTPSGSSETALMSYHADYASTYNLSALTVGVPTAFYYSGAALTDSEYIDLDNALKEASNSIRYTEMLTTSGNYTVPDGITELLVECWGGGATGCGRTVNGAAAGGGGGAYSASLVSVTPGQVIPISIGVGGVGNSGLGSAGGDTSWNSGAVLAKGGLQPSSAIIGGLGGDAGSGAGDVRFSGGNGGSSSGTDISYTSGSGGSAASRSGNGLNGLDGIISTASRRANYNVLGAGAPGTSTAANFNGTPGMFGSGGGGARRTSSTRLGGNGGDGYIRVSCPIVY